MPPYASIALAQNRLEFFSHQAGVRQDRDLTEDDLEQLARWTRRHRELSGERNDPGALMKLGHELHAWLNGADRALDRMLEASTPPLHIEFSAPKRDSETARAFLDAPWELLAQDERHWALDGEILFSPVRRIGKAVDPPGASPNCLSLVFMAAAPRGAANLDYEAEETSILDATKSTGLDKGEVDQALKLHNEQLAIFEALGDKRSHAVTLGGIARILTAKGEVDQALELHNERLAIFEALGDKRERAVTLGDIAQINAAKGDLNRALELQQESLNVTEGLGDKDGIASALWAIAQLYLEQQRSQEAFDHAARSYRLLLQSGRLDGICIVGLTLGQFLCASGASDEGLKVLTRSRDGFQKLGQLEMAQQTQALIDHFSQADPGPDNAEGAGA